MGYGKRKEKKKNEKQNSCYTLQLAESDFRVPARAAARGKREGQKKENRL